ARLRLANTQPRGDEHEVGDTARRRTALWHGNHDVRCTALTLDSTALTRVPALRRDMRLQWEAAQQAHVLLYPAGMVQLNASPAAILTRCDGERTLGDIVTELEQVYSQSLRDEVLAFVALASERSWLELVR